MTTRRSQAGVTLIEMVIILAVVAIIAVVIFPALGNLLQVIASKGASEEVAGAIRLARQHAITKGTNHCIRFVGTAPNTAYQVQLASSDTACDGAIVEGPTIITQGLAVVDLSPLPAGGSIIIFNPIGNVTNFTPGNPSVTAAVDTVPPSCLSDVLVSLFGGVRVSRQC